METNVLIPIYNLRSSHGIGDLKFKKGESGLPNPAVVATDFNSKSHKWGYSKEDENCKALGDLSVYLGVVVWNFGNKLMFVGRRQFHVNLMFMSKSAPSQMAGHL